MPSSGTEADIFQAEMIDLMEALEYVRAYIDDLLVITRETLEDHLEKLRGSQETTRSGVESQRRQIIFLYPRHRYLGYILTRNGIKPQPKKVQAILALNPPNNVKELWHFFCMVQYSRDMWAKRSEMLALLSNLVGESGEKKNTRKNKVK